MKSYQLNELVGFEAVNSRQGGDFTLHLKNGEEIDFQSFVSSCVEETEIFIYRNGTQNKSFFINENLELPAEKQEDDKIWREIYALQDELKRIEDYVSAHTNVETIETKGRNIRLSHTGKGLIDNGETTHYYDKVTCTLSDDEMQEINLKKAKLNKRLDELSYLVEE